MAENGEPKESKSITWDAVRNALTLLSLLGVAGATYGYVTGDVAREREKTNVAKETCAQTVSALSRELHALVISEREKEETKCEVECWYGLARQLQALLNECHGVNPFPLPSEPGQYGSPEK